MKLEQFEGTSKLVIRLIILKRFNTSSDDSFKIRNEDKRHYASLIFRGRDQ